MTARLVSISLLLLGLVTCVGGAATGWPWIGPGCVVIATVVLSLRMKDPLRRLGLATLVALLGTGLESVFIRVGIYLPEGTLPDSLLCPLWISACWFSLGLALPGFVPPDKLGYVRVAVCGALIAPLVYLAADDLLWGALHLRRPLWPTLMLLALLWQGLLPGLCWLAQTRWYRS